MLRPDDPDAIRLLEARHHDPFAVLGRHGDAVRAFLPHTRNAWLEDETRPMRRVGNTDLFEYTGDLRGLPRHYRLVLEDGEGVRRVRHEPWTFGSAIGEQDLWYFNAGKHTRAQEFLGANPRTLDGIAGTLFAVWAPNAERVSVVGDFNRWDGRCHPMRNLGASGVWELFVPGLHEGVYKFEIRNRATGALFLKADPYAKGSELRPATASVIVHSRHAWQDGDWMAARRQRDWRRAPLAIYELHPGSWRRRADGGFLDWGTLASELASYLEDLGFTHLELLPVSEHPLDESWGYQTTGYFAPTCRFGTPDGFRAFVDHCHRRGIGVILDWVPAHFPRDAHALANFDGTALYEYHDPRKAEHRDWGTLVFNYERNEVRSFLISNALYWLNEFHVDGLRVDAVASMLYLDFSRRGEDWVPNRYGGNHNLEAIDFLREMNDAVAREAPGCLTIAEESTDWAGVTAPTGQGGLGFSLKWNMGWMHDTLRYFAKDPVHRKHHQDWLTFSSLYAFNESFVLPLSHDEVVHLKRSLFGKMPGDEWQRFANLRLLYTWQWTFPGKKLLFMGGEFAQETEWNSNQALPWERMGHPGAAGVAALVGDLNRLHRDRPALHAGDCEPGGFEWLSGEDWQHSVLAWMRHGPGETVVAVLNFTPVVREGYRIGVPEAGRWTEILNSDCTRYGGSGVRNGPLESEPVPWQGRAHSIVLTLPPLGGVLLARTVTS